MKRIRYRSRWMFALTVAIALGICASPGGAVAVSGATVRVSVSSSGAQADRYSYSGYPSISSDGRYVAFMSVAPNLVAGDTNGWWDVFVRDRDTGTTARVSVDSSSAQANGGSSSPSISSDARYVAFESDASNLVAGDTNGASDVFVHDRVTGVTTRASVSSTGAQGDGPSGHPSVSSDGRYVAYESASSNLVTGDTNGASDIFVHDSVTGATTRVSVDSSGAEGNGRGDYPSISSDGRCVAFGSWASDLVAGDTNGRRDAFVHDRDTGATTRVSVDSSGAQGNGSGDSPSISSDGRYVAFWSEASNLVAGDTNGWWDAFVHDRATGATTRVSVASSGAQGNDHAMTSARGPSISSDGRYVAFASWASNLVASDTNGTFDVFVHDRVTGATTRASVDSAGAQGTDTSVFPSISSDGAYVAFQSGASNLVAGDTNGSQDVFVNEVSFDAPPAAPTSIAIKTSATTARPGSVPILSGAVAPTGMIGVNIVVYVRKPGKAYWSYSSRRTTYALGGGAAWQYKYYFKPGMAKGYYIFKAVVPAYPGHFLASTSPNTVTIRLR